MGRCGIRGLRLLDFDGCSSSTCSLCTTVGPGDLKSVLHRKAGLNFEYPITPKMSVYSDQRSGVQYPSALSRDTARIGRCPLKSRSESLRTCSANVEFFPCLNSFSGNVKGKTATSPNTHNADDFPELFGPVKMLTCGSKVNSTSSNGPTFVKLRLVMGIRHLPKSMEVGISPSLPGIGCRAVDLDPCIHQP